MSHIIYVHTRADGTPINAWVRDCDVDARDGRGTFSFTTTLAEAKHFTSFTDAFNYWRRQSIVRPLRDDGKPNRPLTAFTIEPQLLKVEETQ